MNFETMFSLASTLVMPGWAWDTVVWLGFAINAVVAEVWINVTRRQPRPIPSRAPRQERALQAT
ncbi:MAG TPA: hypothetical protein VGX76_22405 [Pirellulales bacterium]|nr:hypothetical protein [Pirellulales bacterium]